MFPVEAETPDQRAALIFLVLLVHHPLSTIPPPPHLLHNPLTVIQSCRTTNLHQALAITRRSMLASVADSPSRDHVERRLSRKATNLIKTFPLWNYPFVSHQRY